MIETFMNIFMSLGSSVFIPAIIIVLGLILRMKPGKAIVAGLTIGIGFYWTKYGYWIDDRCFRTSS